MFSCLEYPKMCDLWSECQEFETPYDMYTPLTMFFVGRKSLGIFKHTPGVSQIKTIFITPTKTARSLEAAFAMLMQLRDRCQPFKAIWTGKLWLWFCFAKAVANGSIRSKMVKTQLCIVKM